MVHSTMMFDAYLVVLLAEKDVLTDGQTDRLTDGQTDICISRAAFAAENIILGVFMNFIPLLNIHTILSGSLES